MMKAPPCWLNALLLILILPLSFIVYGPETGVMNIIAIMGWALAETYERKADSA